MPGYGSNPRWFELGKRLAKNGHNIEIITSDSNHGSSFRVKNGKLDCFARDNVTFSILKTYQYKKTASVARVFSWFAFDCRLFRYKRHIKTDVVIISSLSLTSILFGLYLQTFKKAKLVFEVRDIWPLTLSAEGRFSRCHPLYIYLRGLEIWGYKAADLIVGTMPNLKQHVIESGVRKNDAFFHTCGIGIDPERAKMVPDFVFPKSVRQNLKDKIVVGYCGSIGLTNNLKDFIQYIKTNTSPDVAFVIAGDGADKEGYEKQLAGYKNIYFLGSIAPQDVQSLLRSCDILFLATMPSKVWEYGQSMNKIVDYMLAGKFIVAQYEGYPSMINEADCGVFTTGNKLGDCFNDVFNMSVSDRDAKGANGRRWLLENRSYDHLTDMYIGKINQIFKM